MFVTLRLAAFFTLSALSLTYCVVASAEPGDEVGSGASKAAEASAEKVELCESRPRFWSQFVANKSRAYCREIRKAQANLRTRPKKAEKYAEAALVQSPQGVLAHLLLGQSLLFQGRAEEAHQRLSVWSPRAPDVLRGALIRVSAARAALLTGHYAEAVLEYRSAILHWHEGLGARERARVLIEAATAVTYSGPDRGREARHYLALAKEAGAPLLEEVIQAAQALSWLREGRAEEASFALVPEADAWTLPWIFERSGSPTGKRGEVLPLLPPGEAEALSAAVTQVMEPDTAPEAWEAFAAQAGPGCPPHLLTPMKEVP